MTQKWDNTYNPFDFFGTSPETVPSFNVYDSFDSLFGCNGSPSSQSGHVVDDSKRNITGNETVKYRIHDNQALAQEQNFDSPKTQLSPLTITSTNSNQENYHHHSVYSFDDAEQTYKSGIKGDHGSGRPSFAPVLSVQQAKALAAEKEIAADVQKRPTSSLSGKSTSDIILSDLKVRSPTRRITTVSAMSQKEASEKFKLRFGDPAAEKKRQKEIAATLASANKPKKVDPKQHPDRPKRNSDPIRSALSKPMNVSMNSSTKCNIVLDKSKPKTKVVPLHVLV